MLPEAFASHAVEDEVNRRVENQQYAFHQRANVLPNGFLITSVKRGSTELISLADWHFIDVQQNPWQMTEQKRSRQAKECDIKIPLMYGCLWWTLLLLVLSFLFNS